MFWIWRKDVQVYETHCTVGMIVSQLSEGKSPAELVEDFPYLSLEDIG